MAIFNAHNYFCEMHPSKLSIKISRRTVKRKRGCREVGGEDGRKEFKGGRGVSGKRGRQSLSNRLELLGLKKGSIQGLGERAGRREGRGGGAHISSFPFSPFSSSGTAPIIFASRNVKRAAQACWLNVWIFICWA